MKREYVALYAAISTSEKLADLASDTHRLFYTWTLAQCDAWGRVDGRPRVLNAKVWPMLEKSLEATKKALEDCVAHGLFMRFADGPVIWLQVPDWEEKAGRLCKNERRGQSAFPEPLQEYSGVLRSTPLRGEERREEESRGEETRARDAPWVAALADHPLLNTQAVKAACLNWAAFRKSIKKPYPDASWKPLFKEYGPKGEERFIAAVDHTMAKGWQGLVEPDVPRDARPSPQEEDWTKGLTIIPSRS